MAVAVRRARAEDAAKLGEFATLLTEQHVGYDPVRFASIVTPKGAEAFYRTRIDADDAAIVVAEIDDDIVGFAYIKHEPQAFEDILENAVWVHDIYVDETERASGVGRALMNAVTEEARRFGVEKVVLAVAAKNERARAFFASLGFRTTMHEMMVEID